MTRWLLAAAFGLVAPLASAAGVNVRPLTAADVPALVAPPAHGTRIIMLWSLDCVYCEPNMQALAKLQQSDTAEVEFITVATDNVGARTRIAARLAAAGLTHQPAWAYADAAPERLNYLIDATWGGEMPRTLVIHADGHRTALSGLLTPSQLTALLPASKR